VLVKEIPMPITDRLAHVPICIEFTVQISHSMVCMLHFIQVDSRL